MATAIDYAGAWQRLNEALARNVDQAEGDAEMFAFLFTSTLAAFVAGSVQPGCRDRRRAIARPADAASPGAASAPGRSLDVSVLCAASARAELARDRLELIARLTGAAGFSGGLPPAPFRHHSFPFWAAFALLFCLRRSSVVSFSSGVRVKGLVRPAGA